MGEESSRPGITDFSEPWGSSEQRIFRLVSLPAFAPAVWKGGQENDSHPLTQVAWRGHASRAGGSLFGGFMMEGVLWGPLVVNAGGIRFFWLQSW